MTNVPEEERGPESGLTDKDLVDALYNIYAPTPSDKRLNAGELRQELGRLEPYTKLPGHQGDIAKILKERASNALGETGDNADRTAEHIDSAARKIREKIMDWKALSEELKQLGNPDVPPPVYYEEK